ICARLAPASRLSLALRGAATSAIHPLSLHAALPIFRHNALLFILHISGWCPVRAGNGAISGRCCRLFASQRKKSATPAADRAVRSEEHTSELQSRENLVCRLLLEKKKKKNTNHDKII